MSTVQTNFSTRFAALEQQKEALEKLTTPQLYIEMVPCEGFAFAGIPLDVVKLNAIPIHYTYSHYQTAAKVLNLALALFSKDEQLTNEQYVKCMREVVDAWRDFNRICKAAKVTDAFTYSEIITRATAQLKELDKLIMPVQ